MSYSSTAAIRATSRATRTTASNIAIQNVNAGKGVETVFSTSTVSGALNSVSYVTASERQTISQGGSIIASGVATDISLKGQGMLPVRSNPNDPNSEILFTREGSFRKTQNGDYVNIGGMGMVGWKLDANGNPPVNSSLFDSLQNINLRDAYTQPIATSLIAINMNLQASQSALTGAGEVMQVNRGGLNANITENDIIVPENMTNSSLKQGDQITLTSTPPNSPKIFEYGGISVSKQVTSGGGFYGSRTIGGNFTIVAGTPTNNQISAGTGMKILVNGNETLVTASQNPNSAVGQNQFNSLDSLKSAINNVSGLVATIKGGRLYVASTQGNATIQFQDYSGSNMVETLGLTDVAAPGAGVERFATLKTLKDKINTNNVVTGLKAENGSVSGALDIHTLLATSGFNINGTSFGTTNFGFISTNGSTFGVADGGIERGAASINIISPNHGLQIGDLVNVTGLAATNGGSDGHFMVSNISNDTFTINCADAPNNFTLVTTPITAVNGTWQKIAGQTFSERDRNAANIGAGGDNTKLRITDAGDPPPGVGGHRLVTNDVVYISGLGARQVGGRYYVVPDGYYSVTKIDANNFDIVATSNNNIVPVGVVPVGNFSYQKIGSRADANIANGIHFDNTVMATVGAVGEKTIKMYISNNNYNINDFIKLSGLGPLDGNNAFVFNGLNLRNDFAYKIIDRDNDSVTFTLENDNNSGAIANAGGGANTIASVEGTDFGAGGTTPLGTAFQVNNYSRTFSYLGFSQDKFDFNATYNANSDDLSLSAVTDTSPADLRSKIFNHAFEVIDSLGIRHDLILKAAKLDTNKWTVEISAIKNSATDDFDTITDSTVGRIANGEILFDNSGNLVSVGNLATPISITWKEGSDVSNITLDFQGIFGNVNGVTGSITQNDGLSDMHSIEQNGITAAIIEDIEIDESGYIIGRFTNGELKKLYQIPVATFVNIDGLEPGESNSFRVSRKSGRAILKEAGTRGAAGITSGTVEASNVDGTTQLLELQKLSIQSQMDGRAAAVAFQDTRTLLNELGR